MKKKIPILLLTRDRPNLLEKVLARIIRYTNWEEYELWILDNFSSPANRKVIALFKDNYPFINVYSINYNQLALIQNEVIAKLKAEIYIKIDDDILVSENWTQPFVDVYQRNHRDISFGSVVIPINGFGWVPFLKIMKLEQDFKEKFPSVPFIQACFEPAVVTDFKVNEYFWNHCLDIDQTARTFISNQNGRFEDLICPHRYSIGAIVFSHSFWEKMGGWKVQDNYNSRLKKQKFFQGVANKYYRFREGKPHTAYSNLNVLADVISGTSLGVAGLEEEAVYNYSIEKGLKIPITTDGIVFHFSFGSVDQYLMNKVYLKIKF